MFLNFRPAAFCVFPSSFSSSFAVSGSFGPSVILVIVQQEGDLDNGDAGFQKEDVQKLVEEHEQSIREKNEELKQSKRQNAALADEVISLLDEVISLNRGPVPVISMEVFRLPTSLVCELRRNGRCG